jgi:hypothetical protein
MCLVVALLVGPLASLPVPGAGTGLHMRTDLSKAHASFWGEDAGDYSGYSVAGAGDVNGDGYDDILVGAYEDDDGGSNAGQVYLIFGKPGGWTMDFDLSNADASFVGENADDEAGYPVAGAGDVNGDGYDDILIGASWNDDGGHWTGQTYLIFGKVSGWAMDTDLSSADASFWGEYMSDHSGGSVAGAGDVNRDGYDDILIGAGGNDDGGSGAGQTYLILGKASGWAMDTDLSSADASFWGEGAGDDSGSSVAGAGDVNRDGYDDILIGAVGNDDGGTYAGQTYLIFGKASGWAMDTDLSAADASFWGEDTYDDSGSSVAGAGDVNGDGYDDMLIGAYADEDGGSYAGQTYLILGKASGWAMDTGLSAVSASFWGEDAGDESGRSVAGAGDVNGDGYDDILIGAWEDEDGGSNAGQTYLILGKASGWTMDKDLSAASASFWGEEASDYSGFSVASAGDVNGDGYDDILIGAFGDDDGGSSAGQTYLIMPKVGPPSPKNLKAALAQDQVQITLSWDAADSWNEPISGYRVYRSCDGSNFQNIAFRGPDDRSYIDTNVTYGRTYYYLVVTVDGSGALSPHTATVGLVCDLDPDLDGIGNIADPDDDGDGVPDGQDAFPLDTTEWLDTDRDGIGNNADPDDDNDGIPDASDAEPLNPLNGLWNDIRYLNNSLQTIQGQLTDSQALLVQMDGNLTALTADLDSLGTGFAGLLDGLKSDIADLSAQVGTSFTGLNATLQGDLSTVLGNMADMNSTLRTDISTVIGDIAGMNSTLRGDVLTVIGSIAGLNSTMQESIISVLDNLTKINTSLDLSPVIGGIAGLNSTFQDNLSMMMGSMLGMNSSLKNDLATVLGSIVGMNSTLLNNVSVVFGAIADLNQTVRGDITGVLSAMVGMNVTLRKDLLEMNTSLAANMDGLRSVLSDVSSDLSNIDADLDAMNRSVAKNLDDMEKRLTYNILAIGTALEAVNSSLRSELEGLGEDIAAFRTEMRENLTAILAKLDKNDAAQSENYRKLENLMNSINSTSLADIKGQLLVLQGSTDLLNASLGGRIDDFRTRTMTRLENISGLMATTEDIRSLSTEVENLQLRVNDVKNAQGETNNKVTGLTAPAYGSMVLIIIVLLLAAILLVMSRKKAGSPPAASGAPPDAIPLPPAEEGEK